jgi:hypothetical protein
MVKLAAILSINMMDNYFYSNNVRHIQKYNPILLSTVTPLINTYINGIFFID